MGGVSQVIPAPKVGSPDGQAVWVQGLRKSFGYREALRGIDLEIPAASCFVLFGPNGAGKSTLLRILSTRMRPSSGQIRILGQDPARDGAAVRARLGVVFHEHFLRGDLTLDENLRYYAQLQGLPADLARARGEELAAKFGLAPRRHDLVRTFSQGMVKRATLMRSLLHGPRVWILDEPFSGLDPEGRALLEEMVREKRGEGCAVILVTHDVGVGLRLADGCVLLEDGALRARGRSEVERYLDSRCRPAGKEGGE